jgi:hypothetical protein
MALRFADSFGHYAWADVLAKWTTNTITSNTQIDTTSSRYSGVPALRFSGNPGGELAKTLDSQATWIVGFGYRSNATPTTNKSLVTFLDSATTHVDLRHTTGGQLTFTRNGTAIGSTGTTVLSSNVWYYIEVKVTIADAPSGVASCRINGVSELAQTTLDTRNAANASANRIQIVGTNTTYAGGMSDLYICDATGGVNDDYLGDVRIACLFPTGAGNSTQYTPSAGSNWQNVDDATPDGDTTYNESSTTSHVDLFATSNLPTVPTGNVKGVQFLTYDRKTDAGARTLRHVVRTNSNDYESANITQLDTYLYNITERDVNPNTSAAWTESQVNGMEIGYKLQA